VSGDLSSSLERQIDNMSSVAASYQQRIPLKGTEDSIEYFTNILKSTKDDVGVNSAEVMLKALVYWHMGGGSTRMNQIKCSASLRTCGLSRIFYLQVLTTPDIMLKITTELDRLRRDYSVKSLLDGFGVGRTEFLLEALILILECFKIHGPSSRASPSTLVISSRPPMMSSPTVRAAPSSRVVAPSVTSYSSRAMTPLVNHDRYTGRLGSEEPSIQLTLARFGSVDREESYLSTTKHLTSWRSRIREQQLAENRRLNESVQKRYLGSKSSNSLNLNKNETNHHHCYDTKNLQQYENKTYNWQPVHEIAINRHKNSNENYMSRPRCVGNVSNDNNNNKVYLSKPPSTPFGTNRREDLGGSPKSSCSSPLRQRRKLCSNVREKFDLESRNVPMLTLKERKILADTLASYMLISPPEAKETPGFDRLLTIHERISEGVDCDEVFPNIILGNGATVKKKDYLKKIGITHILNAAEYRGVNVGKDYFNQMADHFQYMGVRIEDTPQTQICR
jgi:hypothetical protein